MDMLSMCRICLIKDVRLHRLNNTHLQEIYEFLSGNLMETKDTRPLHACYMCCARLRNCLQLRTACRRSEELFSHLLENDSCEVTPSQGMNMLQKTPIINVNVDPVVHRELKMDPPPMTNEQQIQAQVEDLQENIKDKEISIPFIKQEDMKSENISLEDEELDYSIPSFKLESNSASDNSFLEAGTPESHVSKSYPSISSVDLQIDDKTLKTLLHRMDVNSFQKAPNVSEHLKPTDLEYTYQCNNYSQNVEMLKPNICEEYKQIAHTSSETHCSENSGSFKHMGTDTGDTIHKCHVCEKSFSEESALIDHLHHIHNAEKLHKCDTCGRTFTKMCRLLVHISSHTGAKPFQCQTCGKVCSDLSHLTIHNRIHTGEKPYKCDTCGKSFRLNTTLSQHIHTHTDEKPYKCHICGKGFIRKTRLSKHIRTHTGEEAHRCDICGKGFSDKYQLSFHASIHTGEKPYKCDICGKCFRHKTYLPQHILTHSDHKPYKCDTCGKPFIKKWDLSQHILLHTGEKPHKCNICGKCFRQLRSLLEHSRTHTGEKPYKCDACGKYFSQKKSLWLHVRSIHKCSQV